MAGWLESIAGPEYANALMWTIFALIGLLVLLILIRIVRSFTFGTFIAGGRNRKARLAVMDATAVDSHRRLVLVRRDDVEHLILIGGPTDVVVEQGIRPGAPARRPVAEEPAHPAVEERRPAPPQAPQAAVPPPAPQTPVPAAPARQPVSARPPSDPVRESHPDPVLGQTVPAQRPAVEPRPAPAAPVAAAQPHSPSPPPRFSTIAATAPAPSPVPPVQPSRQPVSAPPVEIQAAAPAAAGAFSTMRPVAPVETAAPARQLDDDLDAALLDELQVTLDAQPRQEQPSGAERERALEEEMSRLLGDLSTKN